MTGADSSTELRELLVSHSYDVAADLLGCTLTHQTAAGTVVVELTEVEAYSGAQDPASHAYNGRTPRNAVMFGEAGRLYVYFSYGMHWCCNVVTGPPDEAAAVLLRAGRVLQGRTLAQARRGARVPDHGLARGPACLTQALGINRENNAADLLLPDASLRLTAGRKLSPAQIEKGPRVGVSTAHEVPWRFWVKGDDTVSAYKRSPRAGDRSG
ncbi:MAG TPA: DNA-3-methyladenine glycosylase [Actinomycetes bacterium]|nr:DNA-3-methyladenine glycosylase [Actinomycetes bacterium]